MKALRVLARILGWLLTPLVALAASFLGATASAVAFTGRPPREALVLSLAGAAFAAVTVSWLWFRLLRRSPHVREALALDAEGLPTGDIFHETAGSAPAAENEPGIEPREQP
ncbi:MAG TPA: hypothetical protein VFX50_15850 [Gemmatimonadales bacterium]|nr:hypothetical protein [Gemmatimonadales bacterium]